MKHLASIAASVGLAALFSGGVVHAQTTVNGPYYATPSWDQTIATVSRFLVLSNFNSEAVLDRETGLVWWRTPSVGTTTLQGAQRDCLSSIVGGRRGWRLPTASELLTLFDPTATAPPYLPAGHPFTGFVGATLVFNVFWTTTAALDGAAPPNYLLPGWVITVSGFPPMARTSFSSLNSPGSLSSGRTFCVRAME